MDVPEVGCPGSKDVVLRSCHILAVRHQRPDESGAATHRDIGPGSQPAAFSVACPESSSADSHAAAVSHALSPAGQSKTTGSGYELGSRGGQLSPPIRCSSRAAPVFGPESFATPPCQAPFLAASPGWTIGSYGVADSPRLSKELE